MDNGEYAPFHDRFFRLRAMVSANACYSLSTAETTVSGADILHMQKRRILYCRNSSPQFALEDLAERVARQLVPDFEPLGKLERGDALLSQVSHDFLQRPGRFARGRSRASPVAHRCLRSHRNHQPHDPACPTLRDAMKPRIQCVQTHWIPDFIASRARGRGAARIIVAIQLESGFHCGRARWPADVGCRSEERRVG